MSYIWERILAQAPRHKPDSLAEKAIVNEGQATGTRQRALLAPHAWQHIDLAGLFTVQKRHTDMSHYHGEQYPTQFTMQQ